MGRRSEDEAIDGLFVILVIAFLIVAVVEVVRIHGA